MSERVTVREFAIGPDRWVVDAEFAHRLADELEQAKQRIKELEALVAIEWWTDSKEANEHNWIQRRPMNTTERLCELMRQRHDRGLVKYGTTVDRTDLSEAEWIQHAIEEMLDGAAYLQRLKDKLEGRQ